MNKKGFAISGIIYSILILFLILMFGVLSLLGSRKMIFDKTKKEVIEELTSNIQEGIQNKPNEPRLFSNMIPVVYNHNTSEWIYADITTTWYDYNNKQWANAVILKASPSKSYDVGDPIDMDDMAQMYVWIPRYKYTIFNGNNGSVEEQLINVTFEKGIETTGTVKCHDAISGSGTSSEVCIDSTQENDAIVDGISTYTHPAFCLGRKDSDGDCAGIELTGLWIGKFEVSGEATAANLTVLPNKNPLVSTSVSSFFTAMSGVSSSFNIKNTNNTLADSHMMKNMEWGAVAYLKQSEYGLGTTDVSHNNYYASNSPYFMTGCGSAVETTTICTPYNEANGQAASTTGNIYGVYDMNGGSFEYVMGNTANTSGEFYPSSGGTFAAAPKYYDAYSYEGSSYTTHGRGKLGDATKETLITFGDLTGGWYSDYAAFPFSDFAWFLRGGTATLGLNSGIFDFYFSNGAAIDYGSSRLVITGYSTTNSVYLSVVNGTGSSYKEVATGGSATWTITANSGYTTDGATFSPTGCGTINGNTVTISNVTGPHTCTVTLQSSDPLKFFTYTGDYSIKKASDYNLDTSNGDYTVLALLSSGDLTFDYSFNADIFLVGGGGAGGYTSSQNNGAGGGGGGYTKTETGIVPSKTSLDATIGEGASNYGTSGGQTSLVVNGTSYYANGGQAGGGGITSPEQYKGGDGGSGGGAGSTSASNNSNNSTFAGNGGEDGKAGGNSSNPYYPTLATGGSGQGTTTRAFGESEATMFAGGGGGSVGQDATPGTGGAGGGGNGDIYGSGGTCGLPNTGGGGGATMRDYNWTVDKNGGGSGIILIRVHK